jgi:hypothetical protein
VPHVEQELLTLLEHLSFSPELRGVHVVFISCVVLCTSLIAILHLAIVLTVILRYMASDGETLMMKKKIHMILLNYQKEMRIITSDPELIL